MCVFMGTSAVFSIAFVLIYIAFSVPWNPLICMQSMDIHEIHMDVHGIHGIHGYPWIFQSRLLPLVVDFVEPTSRNEHPLWPTDPVPCHGKMKT